MHAEGGHVKVTLNPEQVVGGMWMSPHLERWKRASQMISSILDNQFRLSDMTDRKLHMASLPTVSELKSIDIHMQTLALTW